MRRIVWGLLFLFVLVGCDDGGGSDAGMPGDAEVPEDAGTSVGADGGDSGTVDAGTVDADTEDAGTEDAGPIDAGMTSGSEGCGTETSLALDEWVPQTLTLGGVERIFEVYLPTGYDRERAYPVVYEFHGCSSQEARERNNVRVENESGADAILVRGRATDNCWDASPGGPDVPFFDALVETVEQTFCADPERRFATGYSSGSFFSHRLACIRGDVLRGVATIAGGQGGSGCSGTVAALLIHDADDGTVNISASEQARDAHLMRNGCEGTSAAVEPSPCVAYDGCDSGLPVVWCQTSGQNHSRQDALAAPAFWGFLSAL